MQRTLLTQTLAVALCAGLFVKPIKTHAEDIDIFTGKSSGDSGNPRILIVLDNSSNWSRQNQKWPGGLTQGESEVRAIETVMSGLGEKVSLGLMEFNTAGSAQDNGGFVRFAVKAMDDTNKQAFKDTLRTIGGDINGPLEKINMSEYGNLMYDVYNYLAGTNGHSPNGTNALRADEEGYVEGSAYKTFKSPLNKDNTCGKTYMIFIGNPSSSGPKADEASNTEALKNLGGDTSQIKLPNFVSKTVSTKSNLGNTSYCYASDTAAAAELNTTFKTACEGYDSCAIGAATSPSGAIQCNDNTRAYSVVRTVQTPATTTIAAGTWVTGTPVTTSGTTTNKYGSAAAVDPNSDHGNLSCPTGGKVGNVETRYTCTYSVGAAVSAASTATTALSSSCYSAIGTGNNQWDASGTDKGGLSCPTGDTCTYSGVLSNDTTGCNGNRKHVTVTQTANHAKRTYTVTQTATPETKSDVPVTTPAGSTSSTLGYTAQCYGTAPTSTNDFASECSATNASCTISSAQTQSTGSVCAPGTSVYSVLGTTNTITNEATTGSTLDTKPYNADEWARFMHDKGIPVTGTTIRPSVLTYTIDVHNAQPNAAHTSLLLSMAKVGGGKYFLAKNEQAIIAALNQIISEILAINSVFASSSLPVSATNRSQSENQVFIGMFRPDPDANPRWFGNLKRYKLISKGDAVTLGDVNNNEAVNTTTGFITPCAKSFWTRESTKYWDLDYNPDPASTCPGVSDVYSDAPDGPQVEKGAVAQMIREGNDPGGTVTNAVKRTIYTRVGNALEPFNTANTLLTESLVNYISGVDVLNEKHIDGKSTRPSLHGDVIHSRPLPVNYGDKNGGVVVYYGANDGQFRAVAADNGQELWSFIAPEFNSRLSRLMDNTPTVTYSGKPVGDSKPKDYFFDGSTGIFQNADNSKVWLFPTMRRGGRMIYGIDVTTATKPKLLWAKGCPNLTNDTGCSADMSDIGQTWSMPQAALIAGYEKGTEPVLVVGGGYNAGNSAYTCEDKDSNAPIDGTCATTTRGAHIYILKASDGSVIRKLALPEGGRSIASDIAMVDANADGKPDFAYAVDLGGNIYRVGFVDKPGGSALDPEKWEAVRIGHTSSEPRKFLNTPAVALNKGYVYLALGSGDREHPLATNYPYTKPVVNRFYVVLDNLSKVEDKDLDVDLKDYTSIDKNKCETTRVTPDSGLKGWYLTLEGKGEQTVTSASIVAGQVAWSTNRPMPEEEGTCATPLGEARAYLVNLFNASGAVGVTGTCGGDRSSVVVGGGLPPSSVVASSVKVGEGKDARTETVLIGGAQKSKKATVSTDGQKVEVSVSSKRKRAYTYTKGQ